MQLKTIKILLIEDNPGDAFLEKEIIRDSAIGAFDLEHVKTLSAAKNYLRESSVDVVLTDLNLPDSQGIETFFCIYEQAKKVPIIVLTSQNDETLAIKALQKGAQDYLFKDDLNGLMIGRVIKYAIERNQMREKLKRFSAQILESETQLRTIIEQNTDGIVLMNKEGLVRLANPAAERLMGLQPKKLEGKTFSLTSITDKTQEVVLCQPNGKMKTVEVRMSEVEWEGQKLNLATLRDISERLKAEEALREAESLKTVQELSGAICHEFSQPLQILSGQLCLISKKFIGNKNLEVCQRMADRITKLVKKLRNINRLEKLDYLNTQIIDLEASSK